jgi:hypothetical protein
VSEKRFRQPPANLSPLFGAELRVDRAAQHIAELKERIQAWADLHPGAFKPTFDDETQEWDWEVVTPLPVEELGKASMVIGDALFNLRAALDYTVYTLAISNNRWKPVLGTQFPIEDSPDMFEGRITGTHPKTGKAMACYLLKVPPGAVRIIKTLQPFAGCTWTAQLRDLSNPDKHRELTALSSTGLFVPEGEPEIIEANGQKTVNVRGRFHVEVTFGRPGPDAADTLDFLEREVRATIALLKRGFGFETV